MQAGAAIQFTDGTFGQLSHMVSKNIICVSKLYADPQNAHQLLLGDSFVEVDVKSVKKYHNIEELELLSNHRLAWKAVGLRLLKTSATQADIFARVDERGTTLIGDYDSDDPEETVSKKRKGMCGYISDGGFVVPDGTQEFTMGDPEETTGFVNDVHQAVIEFNDWAPEKNTPAYRYRTWMDNFELSIAHEEDNQQFYRGKNVDFTRPPLRKRSKSIS